MMMTASSNVRLFAMPLRWMIYPLAVCLAAAAVLAAPAPQGDLPSDRELAAAAESIAKRQHAVQDRLGFKEAIVTDLVANRCSLREVAEGFLAVNSQSDECMVALRVQHRGHPDLECCALSAMAFAESALIESPTKESQMRLLREEFAQLANTTAR